MKPPFQRLLLAKLKEPTASSRLIAASGASLWVFDTTTGTCLSRWSAPIETVCESRPSKRRKPNADSKSAVNDEPSVPGKAKALGSSSPLGAFITNIIGTTDGRYVIASTAEAKDIYVFEIGPGGVLNQLSKRYGSLCGPLVCCLYLEGR